MFPAAVKFYHVNERAPVRVKVALGVTSESDSQVFRITTHLNTMTPQKLRLSVFTQKFKDIL